MRGHWNRTALVPGEAPGLQGPWRETEAWNPAAEESELLKIVQERQLQEKALQLGSFSTIE